MDYISLQLIYFSKFIFNHLKPNCLVKLLTEKLK